MILTHEVLFAFWTGASPVEPFLNLLHSPAHIIQQMLVDMGLGEDPETGDLTNCPVYVSQEPSVPDCVITVYDTDTPTQGRDQISGGMFKRRGIKIRVRDANHTNAYVKARRVSVFLERNTEVTDRLVTLDDNSYLVHSVSRSGSPVALGKETTTSKRDIFTIDATTTIRRTI